MVAETGAPPCPGAVADPGRARAVAYAQWRLCSRISATAERLGARGVGLVLDFPVGVHPRGFDAWDAPDDYVPGVSVGAPPDAFFPGGQSWGISAVRPDAGIADGHARLATALAHHMAPAAGLRVDHVMGLHRQFWVLDGADPAEGVYVRYPAESLWAVLSLVSHRERCRVIGEDLGTVPAATRAALARHGALATWVGQFELQARSPSPTPPRRAFASLSTHDTPTFAGWWSAADLRAGVARGYLTDDEASSLTAERAAARDAITTAAGLPRGEADPLPVLEMLLEQLGRSRADIVVAGLDDLWGETQPQNVPGTGDEVPNWRRRYAHSVDDLRATPALARPLEGLARSRPRTPGGS